jgi:O-antigen ligase
MNHAQIFWEFGKYSMVWVFILALLRRRCLKWPIAMATYLAVQIPSIAFTVASLSTEDARSQISFTLSGPLALVVSTWFFSHVTLSRSQLRNLLVVIVGPIMGISATIITSILGNSSDLLFNPNASNPITSGGFGPNQVSAMLGLGALAVFLLIVTNKLSMATRLTLIATAALLGAQSALTFSRGGLYGAGVGIMLGSLFLLRDARSRLKLIFAAGLLLVVALYILFPALDTLTSGGITARFYNPNLTGRDELISGDLELWAASPIFGVGVGLADYQRQATTALNSYSVVTAHTEFSRLLAEHGMFGLIALVLLIMVSLRNIRRMPTPVDRGVMVAFIGWSFTFMANIAMRVAAPSFLFGLTSIHSIVDEPTGLSRSVIDHRNMISIEVPRCVE